MIELDDEVRTRLARAIEEGKTLTAAYVDVEDRPHISFYGSTHVHDRDKLALWVRDPQGALISTLPSRPHIALIYGDIGSRVYYTFAGRGRVDDSAAVRERVYSEMHPIERQFDPDRKGVAVIIELDQFTTLSKAGKRVQKRD